MILFHGNDRLNALHTRESLTAYLNTPTVAPEMLSAGDYSALSTKDRDAYNRRRVIYLSGGIVLETPGLAEARRRLQDCFNNNLGKNSGHTGLMVSGDSTVGKTTTVKALMQFVYNAYKRQHTGFDSQQQVPVVYIEVPPASTGKLLIIAFAEFFGLPVRSGESMVSIRKRVTAAINAAGTQLIVVDELHNLARRTTGNGESVDVLKSLHNDLPCTFVYAGIDLTSGELLGGPRGQQLSARFDIMLMARYNPSRKEDRAIWRQLVNGFEKRLPLMDHQQGSLAGMWEYLFERTNGSIGSLARLITGAAIETLTTDGMSEAITREQLDTRRLDYAAETARANRLTRKNNPMSTENLIKTVSP